MKKTLFFLLITGIVGSVQAQNNASAQPKIITITPLQATQIRAKARQSEQNLNAQSSSNQAKRAHKIGSLPALPWLGSSANVNGVLDATTTATTANQQCNLIVMTHRDNISNEPTCGTGAYIAAYSTNAGSTWDTTVTVFCNSDPSKGARYPNGVIFNPAGNSNPSNAFDVMAGPYTDAVAAPADSWDETVYGATSFGDQIINQAYWTNGTPNVLTQNNGDLSFMSSSDDSTVHVIGQGFNVDNATGDFTEWQGAVLTTGKFMGGAADSFVWTQRTFRPHLVPSYAGFGNSLARFDDSAAPLAVPGTAWSQDGKTGYVVLFANLDSAGYNFYTDQPIVYKSTNAGKTWNMMAPYNFRNIPSLTAHLETTLDSANVKIPMWYNFNTTTAPNQGAVNSYDLTVDNNGNLHIFGVVVSSTLCSPDSSFTVSFHANQDGYIYDVYTTSASGGWQARLIDSMQTDPLNNAARGSVNADWDSSQNGYVGFGNRLQASRTPDGTHIFCTWEDDITNQLTNQLGFPDVFGQGYDVTTGKGGPVQQFTNTSNNYLLCVSDIVLTTVNGNKTTYTVPCTIGFPEQQGDDGGEPINYYYLGSVVYNDSLTNPAAVTPVVNGGFYVSPNYPNPFTNTTQFNIGLTNENLVSVDVFNLFGQKVYSLPAQQMSSGNHLMTINANGWSQGVYFYRVTVGTQSKTQKMVVQ